MSTAKDNSPALIAYNVMENNKQTYWTRIRTRWLNKKGGFQVKLETVPVNGDTTVRKDGPIVQPASRLCTIAALFWESMPPR